MASHPHLPHPHTWLKQVEGKRELSKEVKTKGTYDASTPLPINLLPFILKEPIDSKCIFQYFSQI